MNIFPPKKACTTAPSPLSLCLLGLALMCNDSIFFMNAFSVQKTGRKFTTSSLLSTSKSLRRGNIALFDSESSFETIRAAVYQPPAPELLSKTSTQTENPLAILTQVADALRVASTHAVDIVLFPELFLTGGANDRILSGALDRESNELNIVGNVCGELKVACVIGYAELRHDSEFKNPKAHKTDHGSSSTNLNTKGVAYNSLAAFHADGSRAGNYRCVSTSPTVKVPSMKAFSFRKGHPLVEAMPTSLQLPIRKQLAVVPTKEEELFPGKEETPATREVKVGIMCGGDLFVPEHSRHLARTGAQILLVSASYTNNERTKHIIPTRSMDNEAPLLFANYVDPPVHEAAEEVTSNNDSKMSFSGSSAIVSPDGRHLVLAPEEEYGDMPCDGGYLLPCEVGALYAADIEIDTGSSRIYGSSRGFIEHSMEQWDLAPRIVVEDTHKNTDESKDKNRESNGFGREVTKALGRRNKKRRKRRQLIK